MPNSLHTIHLLTLYKQDVHLWQYSESLTIWVASLVLGKIPYNLTLFCKFLNDAMI